VLSTQQEQNVREYARSVQDYNEKVLKRAGNRAQL